MNILRWTKIAAVLAAIAFNNWALSIVLNHRLFGAGGSVSEFSAGGQPHAWLFRLLDIIAGLLLVITSVLIFRQRTEHRYWRWIAAGLFILGIANCADAVFHLPCSGTLDASCSAPVRISLSRISLPDHFVSSTIIGLMYLFLPVMAFDYAASVKRQGLKIASAVSLLITILFFIFLLIESTTGSSTMENLAGHTEQLQMLIFGWWLIELALPIPRSADSDDQA